MNARLIFYGAFLTAAIAFIAWYHLWQLHQDDLTFRLLQDTEKFDSMRCSTKEACLSQENYLLDIREMDSVATNAGTPNYSIARIQLTNDEVIRSNAFQSVEQMDTGLLKDDHQRVEDFKRDHGF